LNKKTRPLPQKENNQKDIAAHKELAGEKKQEKPATH